MVRRTAYVFHGCGVVVEGYLKFLEIGGDVKETTIHEHEYK